MENTYIVAAISGSVAAVASVVLTYLATNKSFRSQRWWEKKSEAYNNIIVALFNVYNNASTLLERENSNENWVWDKSKDETLAKLAALGYTELDKVIATGNFLVCEDAIKELQNLRNNLNLSLDTLLVAYGPDDDHTADSKYLANIANECQVTIKRLKDIAKRDLHVQ